MKWLAALPFALAALAPALAAERPAFQPERFYANRCAFCHDERGWGTRKLAARVPEGEAQLTERKVLPPEYVEYVVRHGIGSMPQFTPTELTDSELAALAAWLAAPPTGKQQ